MNRKVNRLKKMFSNCCMTLMDMHTHTHVHTSTNTHTLSLSLPALPRLLLLTYNYCLLPISQFYSLIPPTRTLTHTRTHTHARSRSRSRSFSCSWTLSLSHFAVQVVGPERLSPSRSLTFSSLLSSMHDETTVHALTHTLFSLSLLSEHTHTHYYKSCFFLSCLAFLFFQIETF